MAKKQTSRKRRKSGLTDEEIKLRNDRYAELLSHFYDGDYGNYVHVDMEQFFRLVFERRGQLRLQEHGKEHFKDGHYNAIIKKISRGGRDSHIWWVVTDTLDGIEQYNKVKFAIVAPVTYAGKTRSLFARKTDKDGKEIVDHSGIGNARYLFAITIDLDRVDPLTVRYLHNDIDQGLYPDPTFIVTSGSGLHLYYCFERPVEITRKNMDLLNRLKHTLTRSIWRYNATSRQKKVEIHDINQGYRFPGTQTKTGRVVLGFTRHERPLYHTPSSLNAYIKTWYKNRPDLFGEERPLNDASTAFLDGNRRLTAAEAKELDKDLRLPAHWSLETAREMFGEEWYQKMKEQGSVDWQHYSRNLYDSWLQKLQYGADVHVGHRYWCLWILAAWAWNCKVPYAQLQRDAYALTERFDLIRDDEKQHVPFTVRDCNAALSIYREHREMKGQWRPIRLSRAKTVRITGIDIAPAKRNFRNLADHMDFMTRSYRFLHDETIGGDGQETRGRKPVKDLVLQWQDEHPGVENKSLCARELGIDPKTVRRWWNGGVEQQEPHGLGAAANTGYITDKKIAGQVMRNTSGYDQVGEDERRETGYDLADAINDSEMSIESIMKMLGFPEQLIPIMKPQIEAAMSSPEFWEQYRKANPTVEWPPELEAAYQRVIRAHKDKSTS